MPQPNHPIRTILFDYGGVLAEEGFYNALARLSEQYGEAPEFLPRLAMDAVYRSGYVTGHGSEQDFWSELRRQFPLTESNGKMREDILQGFILRPEMVRLVRRLHREGYETAILSDQTDWLQRLDARDHFLQEFDRVFNSYLMGKGKRDPTLFGDVLTQLELRPSQTIFIDDNPENIQRACAKGIHGLLFVGLEKLIEEMEPLLGTKLTY